MKNFNTKKTDEKIRIAVLQRVCTDYRAKFFRYITNHKKYEIKLFIGENVPNSKINSTFNLEGIKVNKLTTKFYSIFSRRLVWHHGLYNALKEYNPHVIVTEGESNFLNMLQAIWYHMKNPSVKLVCWTLGAIPGKPYSVLDWIKKCYINKFNAFIVYSSYGKRYLENLGCSSKEIFVAVNVADTDGILQKNEIELKTTKQVRLQLNLPDLFTVLYSGSMTENKKPDILLSVAEKFQDNLINFVFVGKGPMLSSLIKRIEEKKLTNIFLIGAVSEKMHLYYQACDVVVLPGRGGIVISEAMAWKKPVILYQADGTEFDLIEDGKTGRILSDGSVLSFYETILYLKQNSMICLEWGTQGQCRLKKSYTIQKMLDSFNHAIDYVINT